ncbi:unnamed protein product [Lactuca saligna]|uniref:SWIM-type domain-containing protein n=1 Tax=Lactuca saligna TaxID=75948 RepID=A0AA35YRV4_LACSI|nr:unnamed protein product [Lactuca saligna]
MLNISHLSVIKSLREDHNCSRAFKLWSVVTYKWIGKQFVTDILEFPKMSLRKMKAIVSRLFNINVSVGQCRNARRFSLCEIEGDLKDHYFKLWEYSVEIKRANPGSHVEVYVQPQSNSIVVFERFYVSFKGVVDGWLNGCRKVIGIDGCFLKGICKGELLSAVGRDGNNNIYPIAWAIVNVENKSTCKWFLDNLIDDINEGGNDNEITLMSDGHKGDCYIKPFWRDEKATTIQNLELAMKEIKSFDVGAYDYLIKRDPNCWSRDFLKVGIGCDAMENGVSKSFNADIKEARKKPLITMLEDIRVFVMERLYMQKGKGLGWNLVICPTIRKKLGELKKLISGYIQFEVVQGDERYGVDLEKRKCGCRGWKLTEIPCVHAICAISSLNLDLEEYVAEWFTKSAFLRAYEYTIHPMNDSTLWPYMPNVHQILPHIRRRLPGIICNETGHNKATCPMRGPSEAGPSKERRKSNAKNCPSQAGPSTPAPSAPTHVNQDPLAQEHVNQDPAIQENVPVNQEPVIQENAHVNQEHVNQDPINEVPINQDHVNPVPVNRVPVNLSVRVPKSFGVRARKPLERINKIQTRKQVFRKDGKGLTEDNPITLE